MHNKCGHSNLPPRICAPLMYVSPPRLISSPLKRHFSNCHFLSLCKQRRSTGVFSHRSLIG
jgi:hypothetical protein